MSNSIRFLGLAILAWAGVRALSLGIVPGTQALAFDAQATQRPKPLPPIQPTVLPPIEPLAPAYPPTQPPIAYGQYPYPPYAAQPAYAPYPVYVPVPATARSSPPQIIYVDRTPPPPNEMHVYGAMPSFAGGETKLAMAAPVPANIDRAPPSFASPQPPRGLDRLQLSSWAMMREQPGTQSLATGGTLGGSQAGARLLWHYNPHLAASLRASAPINSQRGGEAALGVRYQPMRSIPVALTLERRQTFGGQGVGQNAFAAFAEGGLYGRPLPWGTSLDGYFQAGLVDFNNPDWFVDGQAAVSRPVWRNLSAGAGVWGGAQPGLHRLDAGPRLSLRMGKGVRMHLDYRFKLLGNAQPGSGGVVTLAGDF